MESDKNFMPDFDPFPKVTKVINFLGKIFNQILCAPDIESNHYVPFEEPHEWNPNQEH